MSAVADPNTGVAVYGPIHGPSSGWLVFGGTSVAAPLVGAVYGVNGGAVTHGSNPYGATAALNGVTSVSNGATRPIIGATPAMTIRFRIPNWSESDAVVFRFDDPRWLTSRYDLGA